MAKKRADEAEKKQRAKEEKQRKMEEDRERRKQELLKRESFGGVGDNEDGLVDNALEKIRGGDVWKEKRKQRRESKFLFPKNDDS